jgi:hypothetical protein
MSVASLLLLRGGGLINTPGQQHHDRAASAMIVRLRPTPQKTQVASERYGLHFEVRDARSGTL